MKPIYKSSLSILILAIIFSFSNCGEDEPVTTPEITYADIEQAFQQFDITPGIQDLELQISENITYHFRVIFPDVDLSSDWPMILTLHGASGGDPSAHLQTDCYVEPGLENLDVIIISPNGGEENWGVIDNQDKLRILYDLSSRFWPVDIAKVAIMGYSSGGNGSWFYAENQPSIFSAAIPMASGYNVFRPDGTVKKIDIPMYVIHGENDELFPVDTVQYWVEQTNLAGSDIEFVIADTLSHFKPCDYVPYLKGAASWLGDIWQ